VAQYFASGMLANVTTVLEIPEVCAPLWAEKLGESADAATGPAAG